MVLKRRLSVLGVVLLLTALVTLVQFVPVQAAGNGTTIGTLTLTPTWTSISVEANFTNDDNDNNSAIVEYKKAADSVWLAAVPLAEDRRATIATDSGNVANPGYMQYRGSILWTDNNTLYDVRVTFTDSDGVTGTNPVTGQVTTQNPNAPISSGTIWYVADHGNDTTGNGTAGNPWKTIGKARTVWVAGDIIDVEGTINDSTTLTEDGNSTHWYTIRANVASATLDGNGAATAFVLNSAHYIIIKDFTITDYGIGVNILGNTEDVDINNNTFTNLNGDTYVGAVNSADNTAKRIWVRNNDFAQTASAGSEFAAIRFDNTSGNHIIYNNSIDGSTSRYYYDGIGFSTNAITNGGLGPNTDIYSNTVKYANDDCIEVDGWNMNVRVFNNWVYDSSAVTTEEEAGISLAPVAVGPVYVLYNTMTRTLPSAAYAFKTGGGSSGALSNGWLYVLHNTIYNTDRGMAQYGSTNVQSNQVWQNNIFKTARYIYDSTPTRFVNCTADYDILNPTGVDHYIGKWNGSAYTTLAAWQAATPLHDHGIDSNPLFVTENATPGVGDFNLQEASPARGSALMIDNLSKSMDMGAYPYAPGGGNTAPVLSDSSVFPVSGYVTTQFTYSVNYTDADNDPPALVQTVVLLDASVQLNLHKKDGEGSDYTLGVIYEAHRSGLSKSISHTYQFAASDGTDAATGDTGSHNGPTVLNSAPVMSSTGVAPASGTITTNFTFSTTYTDADNDAPTAIQISLDGGASQNMTKKAGEGSDYTIGVIYEYSKAGIIKGSGHTYQVSASDGTDSAIGDVEQRSGPTVNNTAPVLANGGVAPSSGNDATLFTYTVNYTDADSDAPSSITVAIDSVSHNMSFLSGNTYKYETSGLAVGVDHTYQFAASDGTNNATGDVGLKNGPDTGHAPVLASSSIAPASGYITTTFVYEVTYSDADNNAPSSITVNISSVLYNMTKKVGEGSDYITGVKYVYSKSGLTKGGSYTYQFAASDGSNSATGDINSHNGPTVNNAPPILASGQVAPASGNSTTLFSYTVNYTDADSDAPSSITVTVDGASHNMTLLAGDTYRYQMSGLAAGVGHTYQFAASDGTDAATGDTGSHNGPSVSGEPVLASSSVAPASGYITTPFVFEVTYSDIDNAPPVSINVTIDATPHGMAKKAGEGSDYVAGVIYQYSMAGLTKGGAHTYQFSANDGTYDATGDTGSHNGPTVANSAPVFSSIPAQSVTEGSNLSFTVSATDADSDSLTYSANNTPSGASFNATTQTFSWTPSDGQDGLYSVVFDVTDGMVSANTTASITVLDYVPPSPPAAPTTPLSNLVNLVGLAALAYVMVFMVRVPLREGLSVESVVWLMLAAILGAAVAMMIGQLAATL